MKSRLLLIALTTLCFALLPCYIKAQNYSLEFDGVDDLITVSTLGTSSDFTYEMWVYFPSGSGGFVTLLDFNNDHPWVGIASGSFALWDGGTLESGLLLQTDRWKHVAVTYSSSSINFYIDGELVETISKALSNSSTGMTIGYSIGDSYFAGRIDELRIWNTERSDSEIADNMFTSLAGTETGLVAYYNFDEGTGTTLTDQTTNSHDGTLSNFPGDPWATGAPVDMNVWDGASWSDGTPSASEDVAFEGDYDFSTAGLEVNSVFVHADAGLTINDNYLQANGDLQTNGSLTVSSGSSLLTSGDQLVLGNDISFERTTTHSDITGRYSAVGIPTTSGNRDELGDVVYEYDETILFNSLLDNASSGNDGLDRFLSVSSGESLEVGAGYFSAFTGDVTFSGRPNAGTIDVDITYTDHDVAGTSDEENYEGFNLIANPYPAPISLSSFIAENTSEIQGTIYLWDDGGSASVRRTDDDYILANNMGATGGSGRASDWDGNIRSFQGFFVQAKAAGAVTFTDAMKSSGANDEDAFYRIGKEAQLLRIGLHDSEVRSECLIGANEEATLGYDDLYDAFKPVSLGVFSVYSILDNKTMGIQAIPRDYDGSLRLGIQIDQAGMYSLSAEENSFNQAVILTDHATSKVTDISKGSYTFSSTSGRFDDRFEINFSSNVLATTTDDFQISQNGQAVIIESPSISNKPYKLLTIEGKLLQSGTLISDKHELEVHQKGILILQIGEKRAIKFLKQ
ncbi:MAG: LamG domain-containing protein [Cyclobacteriaceae bacterium]